MRRFTIARRLQFVARITLIESWRSAGLLAIKIIRLHVCGEREANVI